MTFIDGLVAQALPTLSVWGFAFAFMTALELLLPRGQTAVLGRLPGLLFWAIWLPTTALVFGLFRMMWDAVGIPPIAVLPLRFAWAGPVSAILAPVAAAIVADFFFYWFHRAQHRWLWRYHAVHHSIRDLNAVNAFHHISEPVFQTLLMLLPTSLIVADAGVAIPAMAMLLYLHASFIHSPSTIHLGPLRAVLVDNRYHRIHHSVEERHFDHNFGAFTTLWDRMFGTAWMPGKDEWPDTGIAELDQPRTLREWVDLPGRMPRGDAPPESASTANAI